MKTRTMIFSDTGPVNPLTGVPQSHVLPSLLVHGTKWRSIMVPAPSEGRIVRLTVTQVPVGSGGGTASTFNVELLNSQLPYPPGEVAASANPAVPITLYRAIPQQVESSPSGVVDYVPANLGMPFANVDGDATLNQRALYLVIEPSAAGDTKWDVALTTVSDVS